MKAGNILGNLSKTVAAQRRLRPRMMPSGGHVDGGDCCGHRATRKWKEGRKTFLSLSIPFRLVIELESRLLSQGREKWSNGIRRSLIAHPLFLLSRGKSVKHPGPAWLSLAAAGLKENGRMCRLGLYRRSLRPLLPLLSSPGPPIHPRDHHRWSFPHFSFLLLLSIPTSNGRSALQGGQLEKRPPKKQLA